MQLSWGVKITVLYSGFVILILTMVGLTLGEKVELVSNDYYDQEIKFQDKIDMVSRTSALEEPLTWEVSSNSITLNFPQQFLGQKLNGSIYFFRPSDAALDEIVSIPVNNSVVKVISTQHLKKGVYKIQISWETDTNKYYNEGIININ